MASNVTAIMTAMTDGERPWTQEALSSILTQTVLPDAVVLLVELGNSWIEADIAASPERRLAERLVQIHRIPLARLGAVRNAGVERARTKWVAYLDGDDVWKPRRLERQIEASGRHPEASFVAADFVFIDAKSRPFAFAPVLAGTDYFTRGSRQLQTADGGVGPHSANGSNSPHRPYAVANSASRSLSCDWPCTICSPGCW